jgi:hypothetical protein
LAALPPVPPPPPPPPPFVATVSVYMAPLALVPEVVNTAFKPEHAVDV